MTENEREEFEFYEGTYEILVDVVDPHVRAGLLPASVVESMEFLIKFYLENKEKV